jgi:hypothetical protein
MEDRLAVLEARLVRAERRSRTMFGMGALFAGAGLLAMAAPALTQQAAAPTVVRAPFRVVDEDGKLLLEIARDRDGAALRLRNAAGGTAAILWADAAGGNINLINAAGKPSVSMTTRDDNAGGEIAVCNKDGTTLGSLFAREDGAGGNLRINNASGKNVGALFARSDGAGGNFTVYDRNGGSAAAIIARPDGTGGDMAVYHKSGKVVGAIFAAAESGHLVVRDSSGADLFAKP